MSKYQRQARRVQVPLEEPFIGDEYYDYADAFQARLHPLDVRSAEDISRCGLEQAPEPVGSAVRWVHRHVLRATPAPRSSPDYVEDWRVLTSQPDAVHIRKDSPLMRAELIFRKLDGDDVRVTTYVFWKQRALCRALWVAVGPAHRTVVPYLLNHAVRRGSVKEEVCSGAGR